MGTLGCIFLSLCPDLDLLSALWLGLKGAARYHHTYTHTLPFALFAGLIVGGLYWVISGKWYWAKVWGSAVLVSIHVLGDLITRYVAVEGGIMLWWPFSSEFLQGPPIFLEIYQSSLSTLFSMANFKAMIHEALIFTPFLSWSLFLVMTPEQSLKPETSQYAKTGHFHCDPILQ